MGIIIIIITMMVIIIIIIVIITIINMVKSILLTSRCNKKIYIVIFINVVVTIFIQCKLSPRGVPWSSSWSHLSVFT